MTMRKNDLLIYGSKVHIFFSNSVGLMKNLLLMVVAMRGRKFLLRVLISVQLCNFKDGGYKKQIVLAKNQYGQRKPLYFENTGSASLSKIGHDFKK